MANNKSTILLSIAFLALIAFAAAGNGKGNKKNSWNYQKKIGKLGGDDAIFACYERCDESALPFVNAVTNAITEDGAQQHRHCMIGCNNDYLVRTNKIQERTQVQPAEDPAEGNKRVARAPSSTRSVTPTNTPSTSITPSVSGTPAASLSPSKSPSPPPTISCNMGYHIPMYFNRCGQDTFGRNAVGGCQWQGCLPSCVTGGEYSGFDVCNKNGMFGCQYDANYCNDDNQGNSACLFQNASERGWTGWACVPPCA